VAAVAHLHENNILHCDIKGDNIVIQDSKAPIPVPILLDFELSKKAEDRIEGLTAKSTMIGGTTVYWAPELFSGAISRPTVQTDSYALGRVLYEFFFPSLLSPMNRIDNCELLDFPNSSRDLEELICGLLAEDPSKRLVATEALKHAFFAS
jgi:serine/threonine protein kinase